MISTSLAQTAYSAAAAPVRTYRGTEYAAFQKVTAQLNRARRADAPMTVRMLLIPSCVAWCFLNPYLPPKAVTVLDSRLDRE